MGRHMAIWFFSVVSRPGISDSGEEVSSCGYGLRLFIENRTHQSLSILISHRISRDILPWVNQKLNASIHSRLEFESTDRLSEALWVDS